MEPLVDGHGRLIGDLRVSVTDRCNFRCQYCMPAEGLPWLERQVTLDEGLTRATVSIVAIAPNQLSVLFGIGFNQCRIEAGFLGWIGRGSPFARAAGVNRERVFGPPRRQAWLPAQAAR